MLAASRGERIEKKSIFSTFNSNWNPHDGFEWSWVEFNYRVAPPEKKKKIIRVAPAVELSAGFYQLSHRLYESEIQAKEALSRFVSWPAFEPIEIEVDYL